MAKKGGKGGAADAEMRKAVQPEEVPEPPAAVPPLARCEGRPEVLLPVWSDAAVEEEDWRSADDVYADARTPQLVAGAVWRRPAECIPDAVRAAAAQALIPKPDESTVGAALVLFSGCTRGGGGFMA